MDQSILEQRSSAQLFLSSVKDDESFLIEGETLIGREVDCKITLDSPHISRYHAKIKKSDQGLILEDLNSANGTFVNGKKIHRRMLVSLGDEIRFDSIAFRLTTTESNRSDDTVLVSKIHIDELDGSPKTGFSKPAESENPQKIITPTPGDSDSEKAIISLDQQITDTYSEDATKLLNQEELQRAARVKQLSQTFKDEGSGPRFVGTNGAIQNKVFLLSESPSMGGWRVGRSEDCDIVIPEPSVSREHAIVSKVEGRFKIEAVDSDKPFVLNKIWEKSSCSLKHNDHIQIGEIELVFRLNRSREEAPPPEQNSSTSTVSSVQKVLVFVLIAVVCLALYALF